MATMEYPKSQDGKDLIPGSGRRFFNVADGEAFTVEAVSKDYVWCNRCGVLIDSDEVDVCAMVKLNPTQLISHEPSEFDKIANEIELMAKFLASHDFKNDADIVAKFEAEKIIDKIYSVYEMERPSND